MAKKIGGAASKTQSNNANTENKGRGKPAFDIKSAVDADGKAIPGRAEGKLQAVPANYEFGKVRPLKKGDFDNDATYAEFQAAGLRHRAETMLARAEKAEKKAERLRQFGDESTRRKANKLMKAREQLAALEAELGDAGFDLGLLQD